MCRMSCSTERVAKIYDQFLRELGEINSLFATVCLLPLYFRVLFVCFHFCGKWPVLLLHSETDKKQQHHRREKLIANRKKKLFFCSNWFICLIRRQILETEFDSVSTNRRATRHSLRIKNQLYIKQNRLLRNS